MKFFDSHIRHAGTSFLVSRFSRSVPACVVALAAMVAGAPAPAATLFWSGNGSTQGGAGTWDTTNARFGAVSGGPYTTAWNNSTNAADTATFGGTAGNVTLGVDITVRQVTFNGAFTVSGGGFSLTTGGTSNLAVAAGGSGRGTGGTISAPIVGSGGLTISNTAGPIVVTSNNTYSGTTIIGSAISGVPIRLNLGNGSANGSIGSSSGLRVDTGSIFAINRNNTATQGTHFPLISGVGQFLQQGSGTTVFTSINTYTGTTTVSAGMLQMGDGGSVGSLGTSASISVASGATFAVNRSTTANQLATSGGFRAISGSGGFTQMGTGTTNLTLNNTYTGPTAVLAGLLNVSGTLAATDITVSLAAILGGSGTTAGNITFDAGSKFFFNAAAPLNVGGSVTFTDPSTFGVDDIVGLDSSVAEGTYTLIAGNVTTAGLANLGLGNAYDLGSGKSAYFQQGSLQVIVVPEPTGLAAIGAVVVAAGMIILAPKPRRPRI